jgi:hypothetical protein
MNLRKWMYFSAPILLFTLAPITPVGAETRTGQYFGNGGTTQVVSGLVTIRSLRIVTVPSRGPVSEAYTTNTIQLAAGQGTFVNGNKKDTGVAVEAGNFTVTNPDFNEPGVIYHWETHGD